MELREGVKPGMALTNQRVNAKRVYLLLYTIVLRTLNFFDP